MNKLTKIALKYEDEKFKEFERRLPILKKVGRLKYLATNNYIEAVLAVKDWASFNTILLPFEIMDMHAKGYKYSHKEKKQLRTFDPKFKKWITMTTYCLYFYKFKKNIKEPYRLSAEKIGTLNLTDLNEKFKKIDSYLNAPFLYKKKLTKLEFLKKELNLTDEQFENYKKRIKDYE